MGMMKPLGQCTGCRCSTLMAPWDSAASSVRWVLRSTACAQNRAKQLQGLLRSWEPTAMQNEISWVFQQFPEESLNPFGIHHGARYKLPHSSPCVLTSNASTQLRHGQSYHKILYLYDGSVLPRSLLAVWWIGPTTMPSSCTRRCCSGGLHRLLYPHSSLFTSSLTQSLL